MEYHDLNRFTHTHTHAHRQHAYTKVSAKNSHQVKYTPQVFCQQVRMEPQRVRDPCSSGQVPSATVTSNFRVWELWEVSHSEGGAWRSPLRSRRAQRASLGTAVYRVVTWLTLGISKFPPWPQSGLVITGILEIPITLVPIHPSYDPGRICPKAVRGWLIIPAFVPHFGRATGVPGTVSAIPHLNHARVPGVELTTKVVAQRLRL